MAKLTLGPIVSNSQKSILEEDLTHATSGLALYPAFDTGWVPGVTVIAPEKVTVTRHSGGVSAGWSIYFEGESGLRYYVTHLNSLRTPVGTKVPKGGRLGTIGNFPGARVPHAHVGINVEGVLGKGKELIHHTNYTHGAPTVGKQLVFLPKPPVLVKWPIPIPAWFWEWNLWKQVGGKRPLSAPLFIPPWAWARRKAFLDSRKHN